MDGPMMEKALLSQLLIHSKGNKGASKQHKPCSEPARAHTVSFPR